MWESSIESSPKDASRARGTVARRSEGSGHGEPASATRTVDERKLVARTLAGDPSAFGALVDRHHASFLRLARAWGHDAATAQQIVSASWPAILDGLVGLRFDPSLRTFMMGVVAARARRWSEGAPAWHRSAPEDDTGDDGGPGRFDDAGGWSDPPARWNEQALVDDDATAAVEAAIASLPCVLRAVVTLRDVEGLGAEDACVILDLGTSRQRALLHRGRERVRRALDQHLRDRSQHRAPGEG